MDMNEARPSASDSSDSGKNENSPNKHFTTKEGNNLDDKTDDANKRSHHRRHHSSRESRRRRHRSRSRSPSDRRSHHKSRRRSSRSPRKYSSERKSDSRHKRSSSRERSHKRHSGSSRDWRSHRHRSRTRSPDQRSYSPPAGFDRAMDAQERLARRLEKARNLMRRKEQLSKIEKEEELKKISGLSAYDRAQEAVKRASQIVDSSNGTVKTTSQEGISAAASAQIEALKAKALAETGIEVPSYYNPLAVNPMSYAQQAAKRKKLWAKKEDEGKDAEKSTSLSGKNAIWSSVKFGDDKSNEKFAKLMGIKGDQSTSSISGETSDIIKKQAEVFQKLDMQYQQARITTHTQRGLGLGFSSSMIDPNSGSQLQPGPSNSSG